MSYVDSSKVKEWIRLEPRPRRNAVSAGLEGPVRDPLFTLTTQRRVGEFQGEDAGTLARVTYNSHYVAVSARESDSPAVGGLEAFATAEPVQATWGLRATLGRRFLSLLADVPGGAPWVMQMFPLKPPKEAILADPLLSVLARRVPDGLDLLTQSPAQVAAGTAEFRAIYGTALTAFRTEVAELYGELTWAGSTRASPTRWDSTHLHYKRAQVSAAPTTAGSGRKNLEVSPRDEGELDWYSAELNASLPLAQGTLTKHEVLPTPLRVQGQLPQRWYRFESPQSSWLQVRPDRDDLGLLVILDAIFAQADDWFLLPLDAPGHGLVSLSEVKAFDVFADVMEPPESATIPMREDWQAFTLTTEEQEPWLGLGLGHSECQSDGPVLERVSFLPDEAANLVWAVLEGIADEAGRPRDGVAAELQAGEPSKADVPDVQVARGLPEYRLIERPPRHWVPFGAEGSDPTAGTTEVDTLKPGPGSSVGEAEGCAIVRPYFTHGTTQEVGLDRGSVSRVGRVVERVWRRQRDAKGGVRLWVAHRARWRATPTGVHFRSDVLREKEEPTS